MALECPEKGDLSLKKFVENSDINCNPWEEELPPSFSKPAISCAILKSNTPKKSQNQSIITKFSGAPPARKANLVSGGTSTDELDSGVHRSITDLPPVLVSEILHCLDAKELAIISCVSTLLNNIASDHQGWKDLYCERWGLPSDSNSPLGSDSPSWKCWKELFTEREYRSKSFMGRYSMDALHGHTEAVRAVFLLQQAKLLFTGGYDSVICMWDVEEGLSIAVSRPLGCTIRAIAADTELLVIGGTDAFLQCWRAIEGLPHLFDITESATNQNTNFRLWGHEGPVTCLALDAARIYSGSWDMSVHVWDRAQLKCLNVLRHTDWVWSLVPRGSTVMSTAGTDVYIWDTECGCLEDIIYSAHVGNAYALARSHTGDLLFTGGEDGAIHMFEIGNHCNDDNKKPAATWVPHTGPVHSLAFEFPWLVSSSSDGRLALIDVRKLLKSGLRSSGRHGSMIKHTVSNSVEPPQRMLHGFGCNIFSVDIGADRVVCGGDEGVVRVWNFSQALEMEKRVQALRSARLENRMRRRKAQVEMNEKGGRADQCSVAAKRNQIKGDRGGVWYSKCSVSGKLKA